MTVFICGDSTAASYTPQQAPITGWGQALGEMLPGVRVENRAMGGGAPNTSWPKAGCKESKARSGPAICF